MIYGRGIRNILMHLLLYDNASMHSISGGQNWVQFSVKRVYGMDSQFINFNSLGSIWL